jgi:hypothetical protein
VTSESTFFLDRTMNGDLNPNPEELTSIIILCCNQLEYTRRCLESVLRTIVTEGWLEGLRARPGSNPGNKSGPGSAAARAWTP